MLNATRINAINTYNLSAEFPNLRDASGSENKLVHIYLLLLRTVHFDYSNRYY